MISIRYPGDVRPVDTRGIDDSFDRSFAYGRDIRDERQGNKAFEGYLSTLYGGQQGGQAQQPMSLASLGQIQREPLAPPTDMPSQRVAEAHAASGPQQGAIEAYIRHAAQKRGIDPEVALKVAMSEGGVNDPFRQSDVVKNGVREQSYGPFQLYMNGGLGNEALEKGIDPRKDWQSGIDFALDKAKEGGWGPWYGAQKIGVTGMQGIGGADMGTAPTGQQMVGTGRTMTGMSGGQQVTAPVAQPASGADLLPPREVMLQLFKSKDTRPLAIALAQSAQKMQRGDPMAQIEYEKAVLELEKLRNPQPEQFTLGAGQARYDANGNLIAQGQDKAAELPAGVREYEYAKSQGFPGTFQDWEASKKGGMSLQVDPATGAVSFQQGGNIKPLTEGQSKDTVYATRAAGALPLIDRYGDALTNFGESVAGEVPGVGNYMKSPEFQQAEQAGKEFLQAILRKDTGAAITPAETNEYGTVYLPRPGDSPEVLAQKKASRERAINALEAGMPPQAILAKEKALAKSSGAPQPGAVEDGYRFNGGDPADPANWERAN